MGLEEKITKQGEDQREREEKKIKENLALDTTLKLSNIHCVSKSTTLAFLMVLSLYMDLIRCQILQFCNEVMSFIIW